MPADVSDAAARGHDTLTLVAMTVANSMILVDQTAVPLATPDAVSGLGASLSSGQWILTANVLPLAALDGVRWPARATSSGCAGSS